MVLVAGMVDDQVHDHPDTAVVCLLDERRDILGHRRSRRAPSGNRRCRSRRRASRALLERQEPDAIDAEPLEVLELGDQPGEVADASLFPS